MKAFLLASLATFSATGCGGGSAMETTSSHFDAAPAPTVICSLDAIPASWVVVGHMASATCGDLTGTSLDYWNAFAVEPAGDVVTVCSDSPIPQGYVSLGRVRDAACIVPSGVSFSFTNAVVIKKT